jgi:hypothetical protein
VSCRCGDITVDGGLDYLRRIGAVFDYEEMSINMDDKVFAKLSDVLDWCRETDRNNLGIICAFMRVLRDSGYDVCQTPKDEDESTGD